MLSVHKEQFQNLEHIRDMNLVLLPVQIEQSQNNPDYYFSAPNVLLPVHREQFQNLRCVPLEGTFVLLPVHREQFQNLVG